MTPYRPTISLTVALLVVLSAAGCRRKSAAPPPVAPPAETPAAPVAATPPPAPGTPAPVVTTTASNQAAYEQEMTQTLNDFLGDYIREKKRIPKDINEMMSLKLITSIPVLPAGKKWVINQQTGKISAQ